MSRITTLLSVATHQIGVASIYPRTPAAPAISIPHSAAGPLLVAVVLGIGVLALISRVNSVLVNLVSQLVQVAAAVGRMLALTLVLVVIGALILLHI
jgi:hypothetical protein